MTLKLHRRYRTEQYTIGSLFVDGVYFCDTIEDKDRGLSQDLPEAENIRLKVYGKTAIPTGNYEIRLDIQSGEKRTKTWARPYCGYIPRLMNVPAFEGVLIHPGNTEQDSYGCLIVGENKVKGCVINSVDTFHRLMGVLKATTEDINIIIE